VMRQVRHFPFRVTIFGTYLATRYSEI
jgi:hypothetical protein